MAPNSALLSRPIKTPAGSDFAPLLRAIKAAGLLERRIGNYLVSIGVNVLCMAAVAVGLIFLGNSWLVLLLAVPAAVFTTRAAFFGHDAGHQQIGRSRRLHDAIGRLHANLLLGMSYGWWNDKHNRHHANPNHSDKAPDVAAGVLVWTLDQAEGRTGLYGWLSRHQAGIFFPLLTLEGFSLKISGISYLLGRRPRRQASNLRHAQGTVRVYSDHAGIPYLSTGIFESYAQGLRYMHDVGSQLRQPSVLPAATTPAL